MTNSKILARIKAMMLIAMCSVVVSSCAATPPPCNGPQTRNLHDAIDDVKITLSGGCAVHFDRYYDDLL